MTGRLHAMKDKDGVTHARRHLTNPYRNTVMTLCGTVDVFNAIEARVEDTDCMACLAGLGKWTR